MSKLNPETMNVALAKAGNAEEAWELVRDLQKTTKPAAPRQVPAQPPVASTVTSDLLAELGALSRQQPAAPPLPPVAAVEARPAAPPIAPAPESGSTEKTLGLLIQIVSQLAAQQATRPAPEPEVGRHEKACDKEDPRKPSSGILENLGLGFLGEYDANKPTYPAFFDMGEGGQMSVKYHYAQVYNNLVLLVYDSRWDGAQFMPPNVERPIRLKLPDQKFNRLVYSRDCVLPLGKLELCIMVLAENREESFDDADERPALAPRVPRKRMPMPTVDDRFIEERYEQPAARFPEFEDEGPMDGIL